MTAETKQEDVSAEYALGYCAGREDERSRHEKEIGYIQRRYCIDDCPVVQECVKHYPFKRCERFKRVFGGEKKEV